MFFLVWKWKAELRTSRLCWSEHSDVREGVGGKKVKKKTTVSAWKEFFIFMKFTYFNC